MTLCKICGIIKVHQKMGYAKKGSTMYKQEIIQGMKFLRLNEAPYVVPALIPTSPLTWITWWAELKAKEILTSPHNEGCFVSNGKILVLVKDQGLYVTSHPTEVEPILLKNGFRRGRFNFSFGSNGEELAITPW